MNLGTFVWAALVSGYELATACSVHSVDPVRQNILENEFARSFNLNWKVQFNILNSKRRKPFNLNVKPNYQLVTHDTTIGGYHQDRRVAWPYLVSTGHLNGIFRSIVLRHKMS